MAKHVFHFAAISKITLTCEQGAQSSQLQSVDLRMEVSGNLDRDQYIDGKGLPRKDALKPTTQALLQGLIANVKIGGEKGWWKEGEHLEYVINELQRSFVAVTNTSEATMEY